jgi:hypothetical protein
MLLRIAYWYRKHDFFFCWWPAWLESDILVRYGQSPEVFHSAQETRQFGRINLVDTWVKTLYIKMAVYGKLTPSNVLNFCCMSVF